MTILLDGLVATAPVFVAALAYLLLVILPVRRWRRSAAGERATIRAYVLLRRGEADGPARIVLADVLSFIDRRATA
jgi:hypothetical protein